VVGTETLGTVASSGHVTPDNDDGNDTSCVWSFGEEFIDLRKENRIITKNNLL
jgi:hypothetical protein